MNCSWIKLELDAAFDNGMPPGSTVEAHLRSCDSCRDYAAKLDQLHHAVLELSAIAHEQSLTDRIRLALEADRHARELRATLAPIGFVGMAGLIVLLGMVIPVRWNLDALWSLLLDSFPSGEVPAAGLSLTETLAALWAASLNLIEPAIKVSASIQWICAIAAGASLIVFNAIEIWRLRAASGPGH